MQWQDFEVGFSNMFVICIRIENAYYTAFFKFEDKSTLILV